MRILLIAPIFGNTSRVASHRPRALAEILAERGHDVTVITAKNPDGPDAPAPHGVRVIAPITGTPKDLGTLPPPALWQRIIVALSVSTTIPQVFILSKPRLARLIGLTPSQAEAAFERMNRRRRSAANTARSVMAGRQWVNDTLAATLPSLQEHGPFDAAWATFGPYASLWLTRKLHGIGLTRIWVADLRDPITKPGNLLPIRLFGEFQRHRVLRDANALTTVSEGVKSSLISGRWAQRWADKVSVLPNGYLQRVERGDKPRWGDAAQGPAETTSLSSEPLKVTYTGSLYPGRSDPTMLFQSSLAVAAQTPGAVEIHYAGPSGAHFLNEAKKAGAEHLVTDHGMLTFEQATALQEASDILVVLSWNNRGNTGILTGKFPEYMGAGKPIVSIVSGDLPGAELTELVSRMSLGSAHEYRGGEGEVARLTDYLRAAAIAKAEGEPVPFSPDEDKVAEFDYRNLASVLEALLLRLRTHSTETLSRGL